MYYIEKVISFGVHFEMESNSNGWKINETMNRYGSGIYE